MNDRMQQIRQLGYAALLLIGLAVCVYGLSLAYRPLGFIVGGGVVFVIGFGGSREQAEKGRRR